MTPSADLTPEQFAVAEEAERRREDRDAYAILHGWFARSRGFWWGLCLGATPLGFLVAIHGLDSSWTIAWQFTYTGLCLFVVYSEIGYQLARAHEKERGRAKLIRSTFLPDEEVRP